MATEKVRVIKIDTDSATKSVKELRNELKELRATMLSTEEGTKEYNDALLQAANIQHTLKEQMEEINASAMDFGQIAGNVVKATGGMVAGFQAATAAMSLFGVENEDVIKAMQKMQNLMAITQAIPAIDDGIKGFKRLGLAIKGAAASMNGLKAALVSTGIGAAVVALGLLASNWDKVTDAMKRWGIISEDTEAKLNEQKKKVDDLRSDLSKMESDYDKWLKDKKASKLNSEAKKSYDDLSDSINNYQKQLDIIVAKQKLPENQSRANWEALQKEGQALQNNISELKNQQQAILDNADSYKELDKSVDNAVEKIKESEKELAVLIWDATQKLMPQSLQDELLAKFGNDGIVIPVKMEIDESEEDDEEFLARADELRKNIEGVVNSLRNAFKTPEEQYAEEQRALEVALNTKLISEQEYYRLSEALAKEHNNNQKELAVQEAQVWMSALGNLGSVFSSMADMIDTSTEEGEEKYKALMYTSTIVSMLSGIGGAIASAFMPVNAGMTIWGQIAMAASTSASVLASGIAQLVQIKNANKNSTLGKSSIATPNTSAVNSFIAPVQYTQEVNSANIEGAIKDSRVYVVESDITSTQNKVEVAENESRY